MEGIKLIKKKDESVTATRGRIPRKNWMRFWQRRENIAGVGKSEATANGKI